jgi:hypothetical protein
MLDWLFEGDTVDETTIDQKLLEEGIDLSIGTILLTST